MAGRWDKVGVFLRGAVLGGREGKMGGKGRPLVSTLDTRRVQGVTRHPKRTSRSRHSSCHHCSSNCHNTGLNIHPDRNLSAGFAPRGLGILGHSTCGVTWVLLTYWSCARRQTSLLNMLWGSGPKEKYLTTACITRGSLLERPCLSASSASFRWMFCLKNDNNSVSSRVIKH